MLLQKQKLNIKHKQGNNNMRKYININQNKSSTSIPIKVARIAVFSAVLASSLAMTQNGFAEGSPSVNVGGEELYVTSGSKSNIAGTAKYDFETNMLTLDHYNGSEIHVSNIVPTNTQGFNITLKGENTVTSDSYLMTNCALNFESSYGIFIKSYDVNGVIPQDENKGVLHTIGSHPICTNNDSVSLLNGVYDMPGSLFFSNGNFLIGEAEVSMGTVQGVGSNIILGGTINSAKISTNNGSIVVQDNTKLTINDGFAGLMAPDITIYDANVNINITEHNSPIAASGGIYGGNIVFEGGNTNITAKDIAIYALDGKIIFNGGKVHAKVENEIAVDARAHTQGTNGIVFNNDMGVVEEDVNVIDYSFGSGPSLIYGTGLGLSSMTVIDEGGNLKDAAKEVHIQKIERENIGTPDTGASTSTEASLIETTITMLATLAAVASIIMLYENRSIFHHVRFD